MKKAFLLTGLALTYTLFISGCQRETEFKDPTGTPVDILLTLDDTSKRRNVHEMAGKR